MIDNSLVGESHDMVSLGKARSMILADNALVESPFTDRDIFNKVNNTQSDLSVVFEDYTNTLTLNQDAKGEQINSYHGAVDIEDQVLCVKNMFDAVSHQSTIIGI